MLVLTSIIYFTRNNNIVIIKIAIFTPVVILFLSLSFYNTLFEIFIESYSFSNFFYKNLILR